MIDDFKFTCAGCGVSVELVGLRVELTTVMLERDKANAYASHVCGQNLDLNGINHELRAMIASYREALDLIAAPERPDGTYNRDRKACEQIARAALAGDFSAPHDRDGNRYREALERIEAITFDSLSHSKGFIVSSIRAELSMLNRQNYISGSPARCDQTGMEGIATLSGERASDLPRPALYDSDDRKQCRLHGHFKGERCDECSGKEAIGCMHGRPTGQPCPHCLGIGAASDPLPNNVTFTQLAGEDRP